MNRDGRAAAVAVRGVIENHRVCRRAFVQSNTWHGLERMAVGHGMMDCCVYVVAEEALGGVHGGTSGQPSRARSSTPDFRLSGTDRQQPSSIYHPQDYNLHLQTIDHAEPPAGDSETAESEPQAKQLYPVGTCYRHASYMPTRSIDRAAGSPAIGPVTP